MRKPSVTRKISTLNITVIGIDVVTGEPITKTFPVYKSEAPRMKQSFSTMSVRCMRQTASKSQQLQTRQLLPRHTVCHLLITLRRLI